MSKIIWIHGDCLSPTNPALETEPDAPALWVWDDALLAEWGISLKRILFIYECLLALPVAIRRGDVATELLAFAEEYGATTVVTAESPSPRFQAICRQLEAEGLQIEQLPLESFVEIEGDVDLKRFSRYWRQAVKALK